MPPHEAVSNVEEVVVKGVVKRYGWFELSIGELRFRKGLNLIIGPNGSGKSTLLKIIAGFVNPNKGDVKYVLRGNTELTPYEAYRLISYVAEDVRLPNIKVWEILEYFNPGNGDVGHVANLLGLQPYLRKKYGELSAGYKKRVQIGIALLKDAEVIIMDEPFSNVDVLMIKPLKKIIQELSKNKILLITSHLDLNITPQTLTILNQGKLIYHGPAEKLLTERHEIIIKENNTIKKVNIKELNKILNQNNTNIQILNIITKDTSEILQQTLQQKNKTPNRRPSTPLDTSETTQNPSQSQKATTHI